VLPGHWTLGNRSLAIRLGLRCYLLLAKNRSSPIFTKKCPLLSPPVLWWPPMSHPHWRQRTCRKNRCYNRVMKGSLPVGLKFDVKSWRDELRKAHSPSPAPLRLRVENRHPKVRWPKRNKMRQIRVCKNLNHCAPMTYDAALVARPILDSCASLCFLRLSSPPLRTLLFHSLS